jgi:hypothetical protein
LTRFVRISPFLSRERYQWGGQMSTYQITAAGDGFRIVIACPDNRRQTIGSFFTVADAGKWMEDHQGACDEMWGLQVPGFRSPPAPMAIPIIQPNSEQHLADKKDSPNSA